MYWIKDSNIEINSVIIMKTLMGLHPATETFNEGIFLLIDSLCSSLCARHRSQADTEDTILWYERMKVY